MTRRSLFVAIIAATTVFAMFGCSHPTPEKPPVCGGFSDVRDVSAEDIAFFNETYAGDETLVPVRVSTQVVAGINYRFYCKGNGGRDVLVRIFKPLPCTGNKPQVTFVSP